jgi:hypothetical protein
MSLPGQAGWANGWPFGQVFRHTEAITAHFTAGWPRRDAADNFVERFTTNTDPGNHGIGPQLYISGDGTVARLIDIDPPRLTGHGEWRNAVAVGVETGNLGTVGRPPAVGHDGPEWIKATDAGTEDLTGLELWITAGTRSQSEVIPGWWTTDTFLGNGRELIFAGNMTFSEQQQQAWALLVRFLSELLVLPRNTPLLPHLGRLASKTGADAAAALRRSVLADERCDMVQRALVPLGFPAGSFDAGQLGAFQGRYDAALAAATGGLQSHNRAYTQWCTEFRGLTGHRYIGSRFIVHGKANGEHDCPGPLFDFHRLARESSDYWWYPFDTNGVTTALDRRSYATWSGATPIIEYYWDENEADHLAVVAEGVHGPHSSPDTFTLDAGSHVYAMSNGELVAARLPQPGAAGSSIGLVLVRHEVFHVSRAAGVLAPVPFVNPDRVDYDVAPSCVYTLYLHLDRPANLTFEDVRLANPDWLNRLIQRRIECRLGTAFYDAPPAHPHDPHHGIPDALWNNRPPGVPRRPTTLDGWRGDALLLEPFFVNLAAGRLAVLPQTQLAVPPRIVLGDYLGDAGLVRVDAGQVHGVRVETFAPSLAAPTFSQSASADWNPSVVQLPPFCLRYQSEWARQPTAAERILMLARGADPDRLAWWDDVKVGQVVEGSLAAADRVPDDGIVFHYRPLEFAKWINGVTWASEWPKFEVVDAAQQPVARPGRPRSRRV